ncbi:MAG: hypothetical protein P4L84_14445 [Isosphaeraceae bacterium]|nr:hypothetical protein [Isosphaeraceae bacterium]
MAASPLEPPLWDSCRALIDQSRRARAELQAKWDTLLDDRERLGGLGIAFLSEASARLAARERDRRRNPD